MAAMKMKPEHYAHLKKEVDAHLDAHPTLQVDYENHGLSMMRYRWDITYAIPGLNKWMCDNLYPYLNDDHIDTALKKITNTK